MNKNLLVGLITFFCLFGGILAATIALIRLENYLHILRFIIIFAPLGLLSGLFIRSRLKNMVEREIPAELQKNYSGFAIVMGFIGFGLFFGTVLNKAISENVKSREYIHEKRYSKGSGGPRSSPRYYIVVNVNKKPELVKCSYDYWNSVTANDTVNVVYYDSPFGFHFVELPDDN